MQKNNTIRAPIYVELYFTLRDSLLKGSTYKLTPRGRGQNRAGATRMELRGFDSYSISLGDEMRGERASLGKTLEQAEADLRIKSRLIVAIESCDLEGFPNQSVIAGYVRSYARYLGMDAEDCYRRFCKESGYQSPSALQSTTGRILEGDARKNIGVVSAVGAEISQSRFAAPVAKNRFRARISLGAMTSSAALIGLIFGLGYGGYALLQDIQRVGIAPLPEAPSVVADAPRIDFQAIDMQALQKPQAGDYRGGGALAGVVAPADLQPLEQLRRDGPISAINPDTAGMFARLQQTAQPDYETPDDAVMLAADTTIVDQRTETVELENGVSLLIKEEAWIRVRERDNTILFEGMYAAGERIKLPVRLEAPKLRSGNAGGVFVSVDGVAYGPVGERGRIANNVSLLATDVRSNLPKVVQTTPETVNSPNPVLEAQRRAEAAVSE